MKKINKRNLIKKLVTEPKFEKRFFWAREMKILNSLMEIFPNLEFWEKVRINKVPSLAVVKAKKGLLLFKKKYREFEYKIPQPKKIKLGEKSGEDKILSKKVKTIRQFIDE